MRRRSSYNRLVSTLESRRSSLSPHPHPANSCLAAKASCCGVRAEGSAGRGSGVPSVALPPGGAPAEGSSGRWMCNCSQNSTGAATYSTHQSEEALCITTLRKSLTIIRSLAPTVQSPVGVCNRASPESASRKATDERSRRSICGCISIPPMS